MLPRVKTISAPATNPAATGAGFARFALYRDFASVEAIWRSFERDADFTPYQQFDFLERWHRHIGAKEDVTPLIALAFDAQDNPLCLLPLGRFARGPFSVGSFLAGKHANYNFGLWRRGETFSRDFVVQLFAALAEAEPSLVALELHNQPYSWHGADNPLRAFPHQPSPSAGYRLQLGEKGEAVLLRQLTSSYRGRIRGKEKKLAKLPGYRYFVATSAEEITRCMDAFFAQKRDYMTALKIPNPFEEPEVEAFLRDAASSRVLEIHAVECESEVLALYAAVKDGRRLSTMISSYTASENARWSPGIITLSHAVANAADRGFAIMDLGVGDAEYKRVYCTESEDLFDSFIPLSPKGQAIVQILRAQGGLKRFVKATPALWKAAKTVRGLFSR
ncbi:MAG TPA: GNAT family N-acetyltransferase [Xanthobacteraceae bacterium]|nr:GNAT family N-acetyltransferase [Xanthobacteraceae bacterium]